MNAVGLQKRLIYQADNISTQAGRGVTFI